ncbi:uncharacterized protein LOC110233991 [Exaiptasia diaphana]|uniref:Uncharacterized protein n=1 Tax=Exaiptasia diaphana TaxID=2652724 RepID=A0A913YFZ6_EXADI|nr:uncharacterized protein LOC110233991 [Exaiptasia diaphana]KXJ17433.1 hypothetical protein AC249_AIPGENE4726 [Exaiptasia diaphana]
MGNNLKALQTAKALTKKISSNEPYLATNGGKDLEISRRSNSRPSLSPTSAGVTQKSNTDGSEPSGKDLMSHYVLQNGSSKMNQNNTDSFVYYLPQANGIYSQPQDETMTDRVHGQRHINETSRVVTLQGNNKTGTIPRQDGKAVPVVVDLTLDDSDDELDLAPSQTENTFPKILAAYSLTENTPFADLSNLLNHKAKDSQIKDNNIVVDSLVLKAAKSNGLFIDSQPLNSTKPVDTVKQFTLNGPSTLPSAKPTVSQVNAVKSRPNGLVFDNRTKTLESQSQNPRTSLANGLPTYSNNITKDLTNQALVESKRNDVVHDVTNTRNSQNYEYRPLLFSSRPAPTTPSDGDDNVVITKVISPTTDITKDRRKHRRKAPIEVRQWCFEEQNNQFSNPTLNKNSQSNSITHSLDELEHSPTEKQQRNSPNNIHREAKIRTLKNLLAKQEKAVKKIRTIDSNNSPVVSADRMLVVEIPDLKSELRIPSPGKHSFRVSSHTISISPKGDNSHRKRPRKRDPRKITREDHRYPSYVEASDDEDFVASKRLKGKPKAGRKSRGRNSPKLVNQIPVVSKDLWHRELQKVEEELALSGEPMDQSSFLMFLGLRKI